MINSLKRALKCRQVGQTQMNIAVSGTATTPVASGPDAFFIESITDVGTGSWIINFKEAAKIAPFVTGIVSLTADTTYYVTAVTTTSIALSAKSVGTTPAAKDADFNIQFQFMDQLSYYF
jgi:hypothetical protein